MTSLITIFYGKKGNTLVDVTKLALDNFSIKSSILRIPTTDPARATVFTDLDWGKAEKKRRPVLRPAPLKSQPLR